MLIIIPYIMCFLFQIEDINNIPFRELKNGRLYSFRGMIQDIYDPEFFIKIYHERTENGETV